MDYFKITKRCIRCLKPLRENGTCQNPKCVRYKPNPEKKQEEAPKDSATDKTADNTTKGAK